MLIQFVTATPQFNPVHPLFQHGVAPAITSVRSGVTLESNAQATDKFQLVEPTLAQQIETFLVNATGTQKELESQFLAHILDKHLAVGKNIDGSIKTLEEALVARKSSREKLLVYLQADNLDGAFRLLNGSHQPLENEFTGKNKLFNWVLNKMQASMQAQPIHAELPSELGTFEAFEQHVKDLRRQVGLCLGAVETPKGGALLHRSAEAIELAKEAVTQQLEAVKAKTSALKNCTPQGLLDEAISHHIQTSVDSAKMLEIAWFQQLLDTVKTTVDAEGKSLLENPQVQRYLQGLLLSLDGGKSSTEEQKALKAAIAQLASATSTGDPILAPVPQRFVDEVGTLVTNSKAIKQVKTGLSPDLLALLPKELKSVETLQTDRSAFLQGLQHGSPKALAFAKSQLEPDAAEGLIQAYRLWLGQQAVRLEQRLVQLDFPLTVELPAILKKLPEVQQLQLQAFIVNASTLPPVERLNQLKAVLADIPNDIRQVVQQFIASEHNRLAEMRVAESKVQQQLAGQVEKVVAPVAQLSEAVVSTIQTQAEAIKAKILAELNTHVIEPIQTTKDQVTEAISKATDSIGEAVQTAVENPAKTGNGVITPVVVDKLPLPVSDSITFAKPLKVVEKQGEKVGWFPALMEQNKAWLPWAIGGTVGLGLLAWLGSWLSKKGKSVAEGEAS